jgi:polysaccharide deacetylase family protein (PEP-CTERM system associated)
MAHEESAASSIVSYIRSTTVGALPAIHDDNVPREFGVNLSRLDQTASPLPGDATRAVPPRAAKRHILTVALEDYYHTAPFKRLVDRANWYRFETRLEIGTLRALDLLDQFGARATFFALGWVADAAPELIRKIASRGHEIATRGYYHRALREFAPAEFREDVIRAREALERAAGQPVVGYRVAQGWLARGDLWALRELAELDFAYDSSIKPILRDWSDEPWRRFIHRQEFDGKGLWEIPLSSVRMLGLHIPIAGGNYFRQWPQWMVRRAVARWDRDSAAPFVMYFHTWELDPAQPKFTGAPMYARVRQYRHLDRMPAIIGHYLSRYHFTSIAESLDLQPRHTTVSVPAPTAALPSLAPLGSATGAGPRAAVTIVVPCYNESATLPYLRNTLRSVRASLADRYDVQVILVDDASVDGTWDALTTLFGAEAETRYYRHAENRGVAAAIMTGIRHATTPIVCSIDCDCTYDPHELGTMIPLLTDKVDVVTASPYHPAGTVRNVPAWRLLLSRTASRLYRIVFHHRLYTYTSCFRVYRRSVVADVQVELGGFIGVAEMLARLEHAGASIVEYPTTLEARLMGLSKMKVVRTAVGHLALMARLAGLRLRRPTRAVRPISAPAQLGARNAI